MKIACIGNAVYDCLAYRNGFIKEDLRNDFSESLFSAGGPALNAASVIAKYGGDVDFYGRIGNDINGKNIIKILKDSNINIDNLKITDNIKTPFSFIIINSLNNTRTICTIKSNQDNNPFINIKPNNNYDFILTDGKYPNDTINLIKHNPNAITIIDAGRVRPGVINLCKIVDYIICSEDFANELTNLTINDDINNNSIIFYQLKNMFKNAKGIVITVGKNGYIYERDGQIFNNKVYKTNEPTIDTNGAGDIFHGAFTYAFSSNYDFYQSLEFANITASLSTTKRGGRDSCPELEEVESILNEKTNVKKLIKSKD